MNLGTKRTNHIKSFITQQRIENWSERCQSWKRVTYLLKSQNCLAEEAERKISIKLRFILLSDSINERIIEIKNIFTQCKKH